MIRTLTTDELMKHGEAALHQARARLIHGRPEAAPFFDTKWNLLTRLSWAVADRLVRATWSHRELAHDAAMHLISLLRPRAGAVIHDDRYLERHQDMLEGIGESIAECMDRTLGFPLGKLVEVAVDRRDRLVLTEKALRDEVPETIRPTRSPRKRRALVPDERVTERSLDEIAATFSPEELRMSSDPPNRSNRARSGTG